MTRLTDERWCICPELSTQNHEGLFRIPLMGVEGSRTFGQSREPRKLSIDDCRFSIERRFFNRQSKIDNRKFPGCFMIPCPTPVGLWLRLLKGELPQKKQRSW